MKRSKYLILIILLGFSSCALKKEYVIGDNKRLTAKKIVKIINENEHDIKTFQARARIDYFRKNKVKTNTATIRILSGEKIWISAPLGAIRLLITNDSIKYYNKLERNYIKTSFAYIENIIGFILTFIFIYIIGLVVSNVLGKKIYSIFEKILAKIPLVSYIYNTIKQITDTLSVSQKQAFKKVVYIEYPKSGIWTLALVTGESRDSSNTEYYQIFVPTTPNPTSGFMLYVKKEDTIKTKMTIDEGLKIIISGGMLAPEKNEI